MRRPKNTGNKLLNLVTPFLPPQQLSTDVGRPLDHGETTAGTVVGSHPSKIPIIFGVADVLAPGIVEFFW